MSQLSRDPVSALASMDRWRRAIVRRHGDPVAVMFSVEAAVELILALELDRLEELARKDLAAGRTRDFYSRQSESGSVRGALLLAEEAQHAVEALGSALPTFVRRGLLSIRDETRSPVWASFGRRRFVVPFSVPERGSRLVHGILDAQAATEVLLGSDIAADVGRRIGCRLDHCRPPRF